MKRLFRLLAKTVPTLLTVVIVAVFLMQRVDSSAGLCTEEETLLQKAWQQSGAQVTRAGVTGWIMLGNEFLTVGQLKDQVKEGVRAFDLKPSEKYMQVMDHLSFRMAGYQAKLKTGATLQVNAQSVAMALSGETRNETYLVAEVWEENWDRVSDYENILSGLMAKKEGDPHLNTTFVGKLKGNFSMKEKQEIVDKVFGSLEAKTVEKMEDAPLLSVSGYSSRMGREIVVDKKPINVQMAFTYDEGKDETLVILASPVIMMEY